MIPPTPALSASTGTIKESGVSFRVPPTKLANWFAPILVAAPRAPQWFLNARKLVVVLTIITLHKEVIAP